MTTRNRIEITSIIAIAFSAANAFAAPTITSGSGTITVDANGAYVINCPTSCEIDGGTASNIIITGGNFNGYTGTGSAISTLGAGNYSIGNVGDTLSITGAIVSTGSISITSTAGLTGMTGTSLTNTGAIANTGGTLTGNGGSLSLTGNTGTPTIGITNGQPAAPPSPVAADPQIAPIQSLLRAGLNSVLFGAHHRTLLDNGMDSTGTGFWATGDFARHNPNDADSGVGEFGLYRDIQPGFRFGGGIGVNQIRQALPVSGSGKLDSNYLVLEGDYQPPGSDWTGSATLFLGSTRAHISRGYLIGAAPNVSTGSAGGSSWAIRLRSDWSNIVTLTNLNVSPYLSYTRAESRLDAYSETGGALPIAFVAQKQFTDDLRLGLTLLSRISEQTDLRFPLELTYRNSNSSAVTGAMLSTPISFSISTPGSGQGWGRAGIELDHRMDKQTVLNGGALFASRGGDSSWLVTVGLRHAF